MDSARPHPRWATLVALACLCQPSMGAAAPACEAARDPAPTLFAVRGGVRAHRLGTNPDSNHVPSATFMGGGYRLPCTEPCHERNRLPSACLLRHRLQWTGTPSLPTSTASAPVRRPMANLGRSGINCPAAAWPSPMPIAGCGLRVVLEMLLAAERTRQNGEPGQYVGDRVMKGLVLACQSLCAQAVGRLQPEG